MHGRDQVTTCLGVGDSQRGQTTTALYECEKEESVRAATRGGRHGSSRRASLGKVQA